jgi:putative colanic acid biosynthesis UDP-glucose lipid carrier transferase
LQSTAPGIARIVLTAQHSSQHFLHQQFAPATLARAVLDPLVTICALIGCTLAFGEPFTGSYLLLALIVFALTYPGSSPPGKSVRMLTGDILANWLLVISLLLFIGWATRTIGSFEPRVIGTWMLATPVMLLGANLVLQRVLAAQSVQRTAVIAGEGELGRSLAGRIRAAPHCGIRFVGYFDDRSLDRSPGVRPSENLGLLAHLADYVKRNRVDLIYITLPMASQPRLLKLLDALHDTTASIYFVPDIFLFDLIQARMDIMGGMPVIAVCESPFYGINGLVKYSSDVILATLILILISPVMLAIAIGIKLTSRGPIVFKQRRYGVDGREIIVYKFRSMTVQEDGDVVRQATRDDERVTRFGAFLRRTSLDELPQFINVLQGRMSVVGPRPHAIAHNEMYRKLIKGYMIRHKVKPGITGLAQVSGLRGETDTVDKMRARIESDLTYLRNWSLRLDLKIILKTVYVVLFNRNAY